MAIKIYYYNESSLTPVVEDKLLNEINSNSEITIHCSAVRLNAGFYEIEFLSELSTAEKLILDGGLTQEESDPPQSGSLLDLHDGIPAVPIPESVSVSNFVLAPDGRPTMHVSPRPPGPYSTYFTGAGDVAGIGDGPKLNIRMTASDTIKYAEATFNEDVLIKDGFILCKNAPFGSTVSADAYHPTYGKLGSFVNRAPMMGDTFIHFETDDYGTLPQGMAMRITVENASGTNEEDPPADFLVTARIEMYRTTTA